MKTKDITKIPLVISKIGFISFSETRDVLSSIFADRSELLWFKKYSYSWESTFFCAISDKSSHIEDLKCSWHPLKINLDKEATQFIPRYNVTSKSTLVLGSSGMYELNGRDGVFAWPTTTVNNLETNPTTMTSANPTKAATGIRRSIEFLRFFGRAFKRRTSKWNVLLLIAMTWNYSPFGLNIILTGQFPGCRPGRNIYKSR